MSVWQILPFIGTAAAAALAVAFAVYAARRLVALAPLGPARRDALRRVLPVLELVLAAAALVAVVVVTIGQQPTLGTGVLAFVVIGVAVAGWAPLRDVVVGVALRFEESFEPGHWLKVDGLEGRIRRAGLRSVELETEAGRRVRIPYARLAVSPVVRTARDGVLLHAFRVRVPAGEPPGAAADRLRDAVLASFYVVPTRQSNVRLIERAEDALTFEVSAATLDARYFAALEDAVRERIGS